MMNKILFLFLFSFSFLYAGDNTSATLGDIKEVLHILIKKDKINDSSKKEFKKELGKIKKLIKTDNKEDALDTYIDKFVNSNSSIIAQISK